jgi:hypothetical protein
MLIMQPADNSLKTAYQRARLAQHGISFEAAMNDPMFKTCLTHVAEAIEKPYVPLPKHKTASQWQAFKD